MRVCFENSVIELAIDASESGVHIIDRLSNFNLCAQFFKVILKNDIKLAGSIFITIFAFDEIMHNVPCKPIGII